MAEPRPADPLIDVRTRRRAGQVLLVTAGLLTLVALARPLAPLRAGWLRGGDALLLAIGIFGSALLAMLRGSRRPEALALYAFLVLAVDALGQISSLPVWPLMVLLIAMQAVAESLVVALGFAAQASVLAAAQAAWAQPPDFRLALAAAVCYVALAVAVDGALAGEKRRLSTTLAELARVRHGIDQLDDEPGRFVGPAGDAAQALRQVTGEARRARQLDRANELDGTLRQLLEVARHASSAHAVLYFDVDHLREQAHLRAACGPASLVAECEVPLAADPFSFLVERGQPFYATDFKRLLWELPWYRGTVRVGSLVALPVRAGESTVGALVADKLEIQAFSSKETPILSGFASLAGEAIQRARASLGREELDAEFKAVYPVSQKLATLSREPDVHRELLDSARQIAGLEGAAIVVADELVTRYDVKFAFGWPAEYLDRAVSTDERTWAAWALRSAEEAFLLDNVAGHEDRMPFLVLDEGAGRGDSLLAIPLRAGDRTLGAMLLTGPRGALDACSRRVLQILANQAAATLSLIREREQQRQRSLAVRDGLTGLYNRRAFNELLERAIAAEDRREGGQLGLVLLDIDHFKKLNDTYGHQAGDAALVSLAGLLRDHPRRGDQAARYGGEEFVVILPDLDAERSLQAAERLRLAIEKHRFVYDGGRIRITASLGVAVWPNDGRDAEALLAAVDRSLYVAKAAGRNRVVAASSLSTAETEEDS
jgi:diguanylate cyclase (GGDEF)-like protein